MIKIEKLKVYGLEEAIRGMRNPKNSWDKSDSYYTHIEDVENPTEPINSQFHVGDADKELMMKLAKGGPVHAKYRRYIDVYVDITAPLYFWKEFETYRVGVCDNPSDIEFNSCSTMHNIDAKEFVAEDFSFEHIEKAFNEDELSLSPCIDYAYATSQHTISALNRVRDAYLETKDKKFWYILIQLLPDSYNQKRTVKLNYEVLANMWKYRNPHKLDEWVQLMEFFKENCPHSDLFTTDFRKQELEEVRNRALLDIKNDIYNMLLEFEDDDCEISIKRCELEANLCNIIEEYLHKAI